MRRAYLGILAASMTVAMLLAPDSRADERGLHEVIGVEDGDMLKMRAGPGTGYKIVLGLPNGTMVRVQDCDQTGSTRWCFVSLKDSRAIKGYVSATYLRKR